MNRSAFGRTVMYIKKEMITSGLDNRKDKDGNEAEELRIYDYKNANCIS